MVDINLTGKEILLMEIVRYSVLNSDVDENEAHDDHI